MPSVYKLGKKQKKYDNCFTCHKLLVNGDLYSRTVKHIYCASHVPKGK